MIELVLIGIGSGNPEHLTLQAIREINDAELILIPRKGAGKTDLAALRRALCSQVLTNPATRVAEFDMPVRSTHEPDYLGAVDAWHDAIAAAWTQTIGSHLPGGGTAALLIWGDPGLYDSALRIAARLVPAPKVRSIPGLMSVNVLAAAHTIGLNEIGAPFLVTTGRQLRDHGWPGGVDTIIVLLDAGCAFQSVPPDHVTIYWGAYVGMPEEILISGPLADAGPRIITARKAAREQNGWIMDIYLLRRRAPAD